MKAVTWGLSPLGLALIALCFAGAAIAKGFAKVGWSVFVSAWLWLWLWASPWFFILVGGSLERQYPPAPVEALAPVDAIVVLGGGLSSPTRVTRYPELSAGADRGWQAARCYRAGKAPAVLFSGVAEGPGMKQFLVDMGVPPAKIVLENESKNTYENGVFTREKLKEMKARRIILVTSAWHLRRAMLTFRQMGVDVTPSGCDYEALTMQGSLTPRMQAFYLPSADVLAKSSVVLKEYIGYWAYWLYLRVRGGKA